MSEVMTEEVDTLQKREGCGRMGSSKMNGGYNLGVREDSQV